MVKRKCLYCGSYFLPRAKNHVFCKRSCFRASYNKKMKKKNLDECPSFLCPKCGKLTKLDFDPRKNTKKWTNFVCECGYKREY